MKRVQPVSNENTHDNIDVPIRLPKVHKLVVMIKLRIKKGKTQLKRFSVPLRSQKKDRNGKKQPRAQRKESPTEAITARHAQTKKGLVDIDLLDSLGSWHTIIGQRHSFSPVVMSRALSCSLSAADDSVLDQMLLKAVNSRMYGPHVKNNYHSYHSMPHSLSASDDNVPEQMSLKAINSKMYGRYLVGCNSSKKEYYRVLALPSPSDETNVLYRRALGHVENDLFGNHDDDCDSIQGENGNSSEMDEQSISSHCSF